MKNNIRNCVIIYNPISTGFKEKNIKKIVNNLNLNNIKPTILKSEYEGNLIELVKQADQENTLILTLGGDGTVSEAYEALNQIKQQGFYAHIPTGTTNDMAKNFDVRYKKPEKILEDIINGEVKLLDTYSVNGKIAAYTSVFGYLSHVPFITPHFFKKHLKRFGYVTSAIPELMKKPIKYNVDYKTDSISGNCDCILGAVTNSKGFAGIELFHDVKLDDGKIELLLIKDIPNKVILEIIKDYFKNDLNLKNYSENIILDSTSKIELNFNEIYPTYPFDIDGEKSKIIPTYKDSSVTFKVENKIKVMKRRTK